MKKRIKLPLLLLFQLFFCGCNSYKEIPYFQNAKEVDLSGSAYLYDMIIRPQDQLNIFVFSDNQELAAEFNKRERVGIQPGQKIGEAYNQGGFYRYLVSTEGNVVFPMVGEIHLAGMTIEQAAAAVKEKLQPFFKDDKTFIVNVVMCNYYVSVLGEVKRPSSFDVERNKITVLEALAKAGDMTIYGKRDNVKLLRELSNGEYEIHELDLRDANLLNSPYYYLQQRDILYVEPNEVMIQNAEVGETTRLWVRGASIVISLGSLLYRVLN